MFFIDHGIGIMNMGIRLVEGEVLAWELRKEVSKTITVQLPHNNPRMGHCF